MSGPQGCNRLKTVDSRLLSTHLIYAMVIRTTEVAVACLVIHLLGISPAWGQTSSGLRSYGGWKAAAGSTPDNLQKVPTVAGTGSLQPDFESSAESSPVQRAFYQSGSLSDPLPPLPQGFPGASAGGQTAPQRMPTYAGAELPSSPQPASLPNNASMASSSLPGGGPANDGANARASLADLPQYDTGGYGRLRDDATQQPVLPPSNSADIRDATAARPASYQQQPGYSQTGYANQQRQQQQPPQQPLGQSQSSAAAGASPASSGLRPQQNNITTGLPFVTPPPNRTGRYPTYPYAPVWRSDSQLRVVPTYTVAAQVPNSAQPFNAAQANGTAASLASTQQLLPQNRMQPLLPQAQPNPAIYPTAYQQCPPTPTFPAAGDVPGTYVPPTFTPNLTPGLYTPNNAGYSPLFSLGQENYNVLLGRGIIGQPTVYVPGQPIRNFMRYLFP